MTFRRTKIVATLGPSSNSPEVLEQLIIAGLDVARLNFSHGSPDEHKARAKLVRELAAKHGRHVALLGDLQGPKIRIAKFACKRIELKVGDQFIDFDITPLSTREDDPEALWSDDDQTLTSQVLDCVTELDTDIEIAYHQ